MIKIYVLLIYCLVAESSMSGQNYGHTIIPFEGNSTTIQLEFIDQDLYIPVLGFGDSLSVVVIKENESVHTFQYDSISISKDGMHYMNNNFIFYGKQRSNTRDLRIMTTDNLLNRESITPFSYNGDYDFPTSATILDKSMYMLYLYDITDTNFKGMGLAKYSQGSGAEFISLYNNEIRRSFPWNIITTDDDNLLLSNRINYFEVPGGFGQLVKVDTSGNIIWSVEGDDRFSNGNSQALVAELSNGNIVQAYQIDKSQDLEFLNMGFGWYPTQFNYFESDGTAIKDTIFGAPDNVDFTILKLIEGKDDYFFSTGYYFDAGEKNYYGLLTKYTNDGNVAWSRKYRHPDFEIDYVAHSLIDIVEHDTGDITVLGSINSIPNDSNRIWLMKLNANGCFNADPCGEIVVGVNEHINKTYPSIDLNPNPSNGIFHFPKELQSKNLEVLVFNTSGAQVYDCKVSGGVLDIRHLNKGIYHVITKSDGGSFASKVLVL